MSRRTGRAWGRRGRSVPTYMLGTGAPPDPIKSVLDGVRSDFPTDQVSEVTLTMSEAVLQAHIRRHLEERGWVVIVIPDMRKTRAGWPDLCFWHERLPGHLFLWELKREGRYPTPKQRATLTHLATVDGIDARVVRPSDWYGLRDALDRMLSLASGEG